MATISDDVIWQVINNQFCAFKITTPSNDAFCRNEYNVTGVCSRITCPLANAQYATVRSVDGHNYLYIKTAERQHLPNKWWQRVKLSKDYDQAQKQLGEHLIYWPDRMVNRCRERLTRIMQVQMTQRRLAMQQQDERHLTSKSSKVKHREASRERKALVAAKLERAIERELLDRLKSGAYGEQPLNVEEGVWKKIMSSMNPNEEEKEAEQEQEKELEDGEVEYVEDDDDEDDEDLVDVEDIEGWLDRPSDEDDDSDEESGSSASDGSDDEDDQEPRKPQPRKRVKGSKTPPKRRNVEYEYEEERGQVARA